MRWKRSPKLTVAKIQKIRRQVERETQGVTGTVTRALDTGLRKQLYPAARVSKQDSPAGRDERQGRNKTGLVQVSWSASSQGVSIKARVTGHYTGARTPAIQGVMRYLGRQRELKRESLLVVPGRRGVRARDRIAQGGRVHRVEFAQAPRLAVWAQRENKGLQALRHVVLLDRQILDALIMSPVLKKRRNSIINAWKRGLKQGFL